ncbi:MAG: hypothetical protein ACP5OA_03570 [Candidatus Woesearchaeota archaeon]
MELNKTYGMITISMLFLLCCSMQVFALIDVRMDVRPEFFVGDTVSFNYIIDSNVRETITYTSSITCVDAPVVVSDVKTVTLEQDVPLIGEHNDFVVTGSIKPQECTASITILEPIQNSISKNFNIRMGGNGVINNDLVADEGATGSNLFLKILIGVVILVVLGAIFYLVKKNKKS